MKTIKQVVDESTALTEKLIAENPGLFSISFEFKDFPLDEVKEYAEQNGERVEYHPHVSRFGFLTLAHSCSAYIHIRSVEVKAKLVYEEVTERMAEIKI